MKAIVDKFLLVGAIALTGASFGVFSDRGETPGPSGAVGLEIPPLTGEDYLPVEVPQFVADSDFKWSAPANAPGYPNAIYDIFTPPIIFYNLSKNEFTFEPPQPPVPEEPFGFELIAVERELFRVQLKGYIEAPSRRQEERQIMFSLPGNDNTLDGPTIMAQEGDPLGDTGFVVEDFDERRIPRPDGTLVTESYAVIREKGAAEPIELTSESRLFVPDSFFIRVRSAAPNPSDFIVWREVGESRSFPSTGRTYTLLDFDANEQTAIIRKTFNDSPEKEPKEVVLRAVNPARQ